jgi:hypothetical protein
MRAVIQELCDGYSIRYHEDAILRQLKETLNTIDNVLNRHNNNHV